MSRQSLLIFLLFALSAKFAVAESAESFVRTGNEAMKAGDLEAAYGAYEQAEKLEPDGAIVLYNKGLVQYARENYEDAAQLFERAGALAKQKEVQAKSSYNRGNSLVMYGRSLKEKGLEQLELAATQYQDVLEKYPEFGDAAHNLEVTRREIERLRLKPKKPEEPQGEKSADEENKRREPDSSQAQEEQTGERGEDGDSSSTMQKESDKQSGADNEEKGMEGEPTARELEREGGEKMEKGEEKSAEVRDETAKEILAEEQRRQQQEADAARLNSSSVEKDW